MPRARRARACRKKKLGASGRWRFNLLPEIRRKKEPPELNTRMTLYPFIAWWGPYVFAQTKTRTQTRARAHNRQWTPFSFLAQMTNLVLYKPPSQLIVKNRIHDQYSKIKKNYDRYSDNFFLYREYPTIERPFNLHTHARARTRKSVCPPGSFYSFENYYLVTSTVKNNPLSKCYGITALCTLLYERGSVSRAFWINDKNQIFSD